jgi:hypothetical protein
MNQEYTYIAKSTLPVTSADELLALEVEVFNDEGKTIARVVSAEEDGEFWKVLIQRVEGEA